MGFLNGIVDWLVSWAGSPYASLVLFVSSFVDSSSIPIPPEPLLIAMSVAQPNLALLYAGVATASSVLGAGLTYLVGRLVTRKRVASAEDFFKDHGTLTVGIAAFTPLPYPVFALAAGISHLGIWRFALASLAGRGARFFGMGTTIFFFGAAIQRFLEQYLGWATLILGVAVVVIYLLDHYLNVRFEKRARGKED